jgi:hypothetical protein
MFEKPEWALRAESIEPDPKWMPRETWGPGPWQDEPDLVEWRTPDGYAALIVRSGMSGALCGYVGLPPGHPLHGKPYRDLKSVELSVHGGLTYADECGGHICHVPQPGEPADIWWLGFDCAHFGDYDPAMRAYLRKRMGDNARPLMPGESYKPLGYVRGEVESLAAQLKALG